MRRTRWISTGSTALAVVAALLLPFAAPSVLAALHAPTTTTPPARIPGLLERLGPPLIPLPPSAAHNPLYVAPLPRPAPVVGVTAGTVTGLTVELDLAPGVPAPTPLEVTNSGTTTLHELLIRAGGGYAPGGALGIVTVTLVCGAASASLTLAELATTPLACAIDTPPRATTTAQLVWALPSSAGNSLAGARVALPLEAEVGS